MNEVVTLSILTCPACGHRQELSMPEDACLYFHECAGCKALLRPKAGDCCVFCSYGTVPCPPVQRHGKGCGKTGDSGRVSANDGDAEGGK